MRPVPGTSEHLITVCYWHCHHHAQCPINNCPLGWVTDIHQGSSPLMQACFRHHGPHFPRLQNWQTSIHSPHGVTPPRTCQFEGPEQGDSPTWPPPSEIQHLLTQSQKLKNLFPLQAPDPCSSAFRMSQLNSPPGSFKHPAFSSPTSQSPEVPAKNAESGAHLRAASTLHSALPLSGLWHLWMCSRPWGNGRKDPFHSFLMSLKQWEEKGK